MVMSYTTWLCLSALSVTLTCALVREDNDINNGCSAGPSSWCSNYRQAAECGAVGYCLQNVWGQKMPVPPIPRSLLVADSLGDLHHSKKTESLHADPTEQIVISLLPNVQKTPSTSSYNYMNKINKFTEIKSEKCDLCKSSLKVLSDLLQDNSIKEVIRRVVKAMCSLMPSSVRERCNRDVFEYMDLVFTLIGAAINPERLCQIMKICYDPYGYGK